jgi:hypothetical protein
MQKLQSYLQKVKKDYAFEIQLDSPVPVAVLEKKLADLGVTALVEKPEGKAGQYQMVLSYPVTGQELLTRICENTSNLVTVHDETGQIYSNKPLPKPAPPENLAERLAPPAMPVVESAPVVEIKKPAVTQEQLAESAASVATMVTESLVKNLEDLRGQLQLERAADTRYQQFAELKTSATISAMNENISNLQGVLVQINNEISQLSKTVTEAMQMYNTKLTELAESSNKLNHRVVKNVKRDANGFITEVTEQIIPEK